MNGAVFTDASFRVDIERKSGNGSSSEAKTFNMEFFVAHKLHCPWPDSLQFEHVQYSMRRRAQLRGLAGSANTRSKTMLHGSSLLLQKRRRNTEDGIV